MIIVSREEWGAEAPHCSITEPTVLETFLHHSVGYGSGGASYMRQMQQQHFKNLGGQPGCDIAYNFVIDPLTLKVYEGRGWGVRPGAQGGHNDDTWAVCIMGDFRTLTPSPSLLSMIAELVSYGQTLGFLPYGVALKGHRDAPDQDTTCPGDNLYSQLDTINKEVEMGLTPEDKVWILSAIASDNVAQTEQVWQRFPIRNAAGEFVPLVSAIQFIYNTLAKGVVAEVDEQAVADAVLAQINLRQA
jgi:hypothetical protein